jgi:hypothetical protein
VDLLPLVHLLFAVLASWRLTELVTLDRITAGIRQRWPHYLWGCFRCVSVWAGIAVTGAYLLWPWLNWPLAFAWLYLAKVDRRNLRAQQPELANPFRRLWRLVRDVFIDERGYFGKPIVQLRSAGRGGSGPTVSGVEIVAASCNFADVQNAIDGAADGSVVVVPAGNCVWNQQLEVTKKITLRGAGIGQTNISGTGRLHLQTSGTTGRYRVTGFSFNLGNPLAQILIDGTGAGNWRLDHNACAHVSGERCVLINSDTYGLLDHWTVTSPVSRISFEQHGGTNGDGGSACFKNPLALGSNSTGADAIYVEDSTFTYTSFKAGNTHVDGYGCARVVSRHNAIRNGQFIMHGTAVQNFRGTFSYEVYNSTFTFDDNIDNSTDTAFYVMSTRGGTGVVHNNTITATARHSISAASEFYGVQNDRDRPDSATVWPSPWNSQCDGTVRKICNNQVGALTCTTDGDCPPGGACVQMDGGGTLGYPCRDQIGRGQDIGSPAGSSQQLSPVYVWNNTVNGSAAVANIYSPNSGTHAQAHIVENRDFFNSALPGYSTFTYPHPLQA